MNGTIQTKTGGKNYYAVVEGLDENGKRKQRWISTGVPVKGNNKRKAEARLKEIVAELEESGVGINKDVYFTDFLEQWLENLKISIASTTYRSYSYTMSGHLLPYFKPKRLKMKDVTPAIIQKYVADKMSNGLSPNTVRKHLVNLSKCFDSSIKLGMLSVNPVKRIELPKKEKFTGAKFYNQQQIEQLLEVSKNDPLEIVILLTLFYGLRRSEVLGLRWDAVDLEKKTLTIKHTVVIVGKDIYKQDCTKNDASNATLPISDKVVSRLERWREQQQEYKALQPNDYADTGYICTKPNGELLLPNYVSQHFTLLLKRNNMPHIRFHDLRHSSASFLRSLGFDMKVIQTWLRHKDIQTTMNIYTHLDMEAKENVADILNSKLNLFEA